MKLEIWTTAFNPAGDLVFSGYSDVVPHIGEWIEECGATLTIKRVTYVVVGEELTARVLCK